MIIYLAVVGRNDDQPVEDVERAMVAIRRSQSRRNLARLAAGRNQAGSPGAGVEVLDVIEEAEEAGGAATVTSVAAALNIHQPRASKLVGFALRRARGDGGGDQLAEIGRAHV